VETGHKTAGQINKLFLLARLTAKLAQESRAIARKLRDADIHHKFKSSHELWKPGLRAIYRRKI